MKSIGDEVEYKKGGIIQSRANKVVDDAFNTLDAIEKEGLFSALSKGMFGDIKRPIDGGKGLAGVTEKGANYFNPFIDLMKNR